MAFHEFGLLAVDLLYRFRVGEGDFVWSYANSWAILSVETMQRGRSVAAEINIDQPVAGDSGEQRARDFAKRCQEEAVCDLCLTSVFSLCVLVSMRLTCHSTKSVVMHTPTVS
jgi:hypothetical protein